MLFRSTKTLPWNRTVFFQIRILFEFFDAGVQTQRPSSSCTAESPRAPFKTLFGTSNIWGAPRPPYAAFGFQPSIIILHRYDARATQHHPSLIQGTTWQYPRPPIALLAFNSTLTELHIGHQGTTWQYPRSLIVLLAFNSTLTELHIA